MLRNTLSTYCRYSHYTSHGEHIEILTYCTSKFTDIIFSSSFSLLFLNVLLLKIEVTTGNNYHSICMSTTERYCGTWTRHAHAVYFSSSLIHINI